mmetsp:Transcript_69886/g.208247  ORF Transcript_69886/g.208247 Transcript_69886/m.208247 type:complete len:222 (-) Transcript_69886:320-985(-)
MQMHECKCVLGTLLGGPRCSNSQRKPRQVLSPDGFSLLLPGRRGLCRHKPQVLSPDGLDTSVAQLNLAAARGAVGPQHHSTPAVVVCHVEPGESDRHPGPKGVPVHRAAAALACGRLRAPRLLRRLAELLPKDEVLGPHSVESATLCGPHLQSVASLMYLDNAASCPIQFHVVLQPADCDARANGKETPPGAGELINRLTALGTQEVTAPVQTTSVKNMPA